MRVPRRLAGIGAADLANSAAFDAYVGPSREVTVDHIRGIVALHDGSTAGGLQFVRASSVVTIVANRTALAAIDTTKTTAIYLKESGREGTFLWMAGDYSAQIAADTLQGIYVKATAIAATAGSWVRVRRNNYANASWFGAKADRVDKTDGAITAGSQTFSSASTTFTSADVGKIIYIDGAGGAGDYHSTTIQSVNPGGASVVLTAPAGTSVSGAVFSFSTDSAAAINRAIAVAATYKQDSGIGALVEIDAGGFMIASGIDLSDKHGLHLRAAGSGATSIKGAGNFAILNMAASVSAILTKVIVGGMKLIGGGKQSLAAYGVKAVWANHCALYDMLFNRCRAAVYAQHVWQYHWLNLKASGQGSDQNYDGFYLDATDLTHIDNAVVGEHIYAEYVANNGCRMVNPQGSKLTNAEFGGCGNYGLYVGDPASGTAEVKWLIGSNILVDSCGNNGIHFVRGSATIIGQHQLSNVWASNCLNGIFISGIDTMSITGGQANGNTNSAVILDGCSNVSVTGMAMQDNNEANSAGSPAVRIIGGGLNIIVGNSIKSTFAAAVSISEESGTDNNTISVNRVDHGLTIIGANSVVEANSGAPTRKSGTVVISSGTNNSVQAHGLARTPVAGEISITPVNNVKAQGITNWWVDTITATTFTLHVDASPTASVSFGWQADSSRG